jgi:hypothetical protein
MISLYGGRDIELKNAIINSIAENPQLSSNFLGFVYREENIDVLLSVFKDNIDVLSKIYINAVKSCDLVDSDGKLFIKIFDQKPDIWKEYVVYLKEQSHHDGYEQKKINQIWKSEKWKESIDFAYSTFEKEDMLFLTDYPAKILFEGMGKMEEIILQRKKQWFIEKLHENIENSVECSILMGLVVMVLPDWKIDYILEYLKYNLDIENFKKMPLFPMSYSWSGSEIPLIIEKIKFLQSLKEKLKGIDYIEHRKYIEDKKRSFEEYKNNVELKEYIREADYA